MSKFIDLIAEGGEVMNRKLAWKWQKDGEKIMTKTGTASLIISGIYAAKKTNDISELLKETKKDVEAAKEGGKKKEVLKARGKRFVKVGKHYILPTIGGIVGKKLIDGGMNKAGEKITVATTAAAFWASSFTNYRKNVIADLGVDADRRYLTTSQIPGKIVEVEMDDGTKLQAVGQSESENGNITIQANPNAMRIMYSRAMTPAVWHDSYALRIATLNHIQNELDILLITNGHITLNDQRRKFGDAKFDVGIGGILGRVWDPGNPKNPAGGRRVNLHFEDDLDFMEGRKDWCWIIFDVDDEPIVDRIDSKFTEVEMGCGPL